MKKSKLIQKKVLWFHSRLEEELGHKFEVERVKPRLYRFTLRGNGLCLGYTQLQVSLFHGEDIPFAESNGLFLSCEAEILKAMLRAEYELEFPSRSTVMREKTLRKCKREYDKMLCTIRKNSVIGGVKNGRHTAKGSGVGKLNRRTPDRIAAKAAAKPKKGAPKGDRRVLRRRDKRS